MQQRSDWGLCPIQTLAALALAPLRGIGGEEDCVAMATIMSMTGKEGVKDWLLIGQQQTESNTVFHIRL